MPLAEDWKREIPQNHDVSQSDPVLAGAIKRRHPKSNHTVGRNCGIERIEKNKLGLNGQHIMVYTIRCRLNHVFFLCCKFLGIHQDGEF